MKKILLFLSMAFAIPVFAQIQDTKAADECLKKSDYKCAEKLYSEIALKEKIGKLKSKHFNNLGTAQRRLGKTADALKSFENAYLFDPENIQSYINLSSIYSSRGNKEKALDYIKMGMEKDAENQELYVIRAKVYEDMKKYDLAEKDYLYLQSVASDNIIARSNYALFKKNTGKLEESLKDYNTLISERPESLLYNNRADVYIALKKYKEASVDLDKALKLDPKFSAAYATRAKLLFATGKDKDACTNVDKAIANGYEKYWILDLLKKCGK